MKECGGSWWVSVRERNRICGEGGAEGCHLQLCAPWALDPGVALRERSQILFGGRVSQATKACVTREVGLFVISAFDPLDDGERIVAHTALVLLSATLGPNSGEARVVERLGSAWARSWIIEHHRIRQSVELLEKRVVIISDG